MHMHEATDADLVELARTDNTEAFRLLLERYHSLAFAIALHFVAQPETAQDLVQEAMLQAYLSLDHLRDATRFKSWFYGIVLNVCRYWRRRQQTPPFRWTCGTRSSWWRAVLTPVLWRRKANCGALSSKLLDNSRRRVA